MMFDIKDYGAVGDGSHKDTVALQSAIDACTALGRDLSRADYVCAGLGEAVKLILG